MPPPRRPLLRSLWAERIPAAQQSKIPKSWMAAFVSPILRGITRLRIAQRTWPSKYRYEHNLSGLPYRSLRRYPKALRPLRLALNDRPYTSIGGSAVSQVGRNKRTPPSSAFSPDHS